MIATATGLPRWIATGLYGFLLATTTHGFGYHQQVSMVSLGWTPSSSYGSGDTKTSLRVSNMGWDNDNFLESLGKGPEAIEKANEEYNRLKEFGMQSSSQSYGPDAALNKDQIERIKEQNDGASGGGEMFKKLMERAQQQNRQPNAPPRQTPPPQNNPPAPSSQPGLPAGFENLSVEAQAALFRELLNKPNTPAEAPRDMNDLSSSPSNFQPKGLGPDGRRIGRNRDADAIVNSADVYFAQLKLDSKVRNQARYSGDQDTADQVFADPRIRDIKLHVNPHMEEQRKKELEMLETAAEEMIFPSIMDRTDSFNKAEKGVSYKDRLRAKKQGLQSPEAKKPSPFAEQAPPSFSSSFKTEARTATPTSPTTASAPLQSTSPPAKPAVSAPIQGSTPPPPPRMETSSQAKAHPVKSSQASQATTNPPEDQRKSIRTLMGLLLKHRGGPGFGSGRLQGQEVQRFEQLADDILEQLRNEAVLPAPGQHAAFARKEVSPRVMPQHQQQQNVPTQSNAFTGTSFAGTSSRTASEKMNTMIAAVEGALQLYKNSPPELQVYLVGTIQATLVTAISTCNQILDSGKEASSRSLASSSTYTDVEPEMADTYVASTASTPPPISMSADPVVPPPVKSNQQPDFADSPKPQYDATDENSVFFESVYQKLQAVASNNGKLGLRKGLSPVDADSLGEDLAKMRSLLVGELDSGIPSSKGGPGASQKYQDMLAKARAERNGNDDSKFQ